MNNSEKKLWNRWKNFFSTIFDLPVLFFILCTAGLACANLFIKDNKVITAILSALMVLSGGISGAFFRKRWEELTEKPHLLAKGRMAVRNLGLLSKNIGSHELTLRKYINRIDNNDILKKRALEYFEEIIDWFLSLQAICLTSIENWEDIIPEVKDLTSKIGNLFDLRINEEELKNQIALLSSKLEELGKMREQSQEEKDELLKQLSEKEEKVKIIEKEVKELRKSIRSGVGGMTTDISSLGLSGYSGPALPGSGILSYLSAFPGHLSALRSYSGVDPTIAIKQICKGCKREYTPSVGRGMADIIANLCDECKVKRNALATVLKPNHRKGEQ